MKFIVVITRAFPKSRIRGISSLLEKVDLQSNNNVSESFSIKLKGEILTIPFRIYFEDFSHDNLSSEELILLNCLFTRHHNGFIRQKSLEKIILSNDDLIAPFVFQLLGEYVIQIIEVIENNLNQVLIENMSLIAKENPEYLQLTQQRVASYWNCYYRHSFPKKSDYVGFRVLERLNL